MSKLSKLLTNPRRFAMDSPAYRRMALVTGLARERMRTDKALSAGVASTADVDGVIDALAARMGVLDLSSPGDAELAVLAHLRPSLSLFLREQQREKSQEIILAVGKRTLQLGSETLLAIDQFLQSTTTVRILFYRSDKTCINISVQFWVEENGKFVGPGKSHLARNIVGRVAKEHRMFEEGTRVHASVLNNCPVVLEPQFPIDVVYTWVNDADPDWQKLHAQYCEVSLTKESDDGRSRDRYANRDELKYSLRSVLRYAPWVRKIFVVTNCAPPAWLNLESDRIEWVSHEDVIPTAALPTFSSHAIESRLHHVPGLSEHFLYFNDDLVLARPTAPSDFFYCNGMSKAFTEGYGSVSGTPNAEDPDYLNAARNGKRLLEESFGRSVTSLFKHAPHALRRDVLLEMEERFSEIRDTTHNRFRKIDDISTVSFMYHHYAYLTNRGMYESSTAVLVKPQTNGYERTLCRILEAINRPLSVCLNDGAGSSLVEHWGIHVVEFLEALLPGKSEVEHS